MEAVQYKLEVFEGPLDLLMHLIQKNKVSIYDIPISLITDQYMAYVDSMREMDLNVTGDFLVMSAHLILIKSKMLLPRHDELGADDPRIELVDRLIEYKKYRDAVDYLMPKQNASQMLFFKQPDEIERPEAEKIDLSLPISKLMKAFEDILERRERRAPIRLEAFNTIVQRDTVPIRVRLRAIMDQFKTRSKLQFEELFDDCKRRAEAVSTFLALLELIRSGRIAVYLENDKIICISNIDSALNQYMGEENESQGNQGDN